MTQQAISASGKGPGHSRNRFLDAIRKHWILYLMFLPGAVYLIINNYIPMTGLVVAFKDYSAKRGLWGSNWAGLKNFEFLFATPDALVITRNTILYNLAFILLNNVVGIMFAIFICDMKRARSKKVFQSAGLFPYLMSSVVLGYIVYAFLSQQTGIVNNTILPAFGKEAVSWYSTPSAWPWILIFVNLWKGVGYGCLIYISHFEACTLDGASKWQSIIHITLPELRATIITLTLMSIGRIFYSDFGLFYQVPRNSGLLYSVTDVIDTYVYRGLMVQNNVGMAAAAGFYQSVVGFIVVLIANGIVRKVSSENALF